MHHIYIKNFGPVNECDMDVADCMVITGAQASGKSTIAKVIYYFKTVKNDILDILLQRSSSVNEFALSRTVIRQLRNKFLQMFGSSRSMSNNMEMRYEYSQSAHIRITVKTTKEEELILPNYIYFEFSHDINDFLHECKESDMDFSANKDELVKRINKLFHDEQETIFIPAGRSLITLLTSQLNYIFTMMNDDQKRLLDYTTQKYIERILKIRSLFAEGIMGYYESKLTTSVTPLNNTAINEAMLIVERILKGKYWFASGEERLIMDDGRFVKLNYTSSGQQESVWIFNIILYQLINNIKTFIILEEPEAHLYPDSQKDITELLALFKNSGNSVLMTTHSPYLLGSLNNLLYAESVLTPDNKIAVDNIVQKSIRLEKCQPYYIENGIPVSCFDNDMNMIDNGVIDGASHVINDTFDKLAELEREEKA